MGKTMNNSSSTIFNIEINNFCRKYLIKGNTVSKAEESLFHNRHQQILASLFEQLLLFNKISIKVYGENIPLAILMNNLGINQLEELIEEKAIEFVLWTPVVTYHVDEIEGLFPLQSGNLNSPAHSDPDESIKLGFNFLRSQPDYKIKNHLQNKLREVYKIPDQQFAHDAAKLTVDAYSSNKLEKISMPREKEPMRLTREERARLCEYATDVLETTILAKYGYSSYDNYNYYTISEKCFSNIQKSFKLQDNLGRILSLENIPDFKRLFLENKLNFELITKIRNKNVSKKFRNWMNNIAENSDVEDICKEYISAIAKTKGFFDSKKGKFIKTISLFTLVTGIGTLLVGLPGMAGGPILAKTVEPAVDLGLDLIDKYFLEGLLKGWSPRYFIDEIRQYIK